MTDRPPIPSSLWQRILAFLNTGATGQIVLDVHGGKVQSVSLNERIRHGDDTPLPVEVPALPPLKMR